MAKTLRRSEWRQSNKGVWTCSLGERGMRVRLFNKRKDGVFYRAVWDSQRQRKSVVSLGTRDRDEAKQLGRELFAELLKGESVNPSGPIGIGHALVRVLCKVWSVQGQQSAHARRCTKPRRSLTRLLW